MRCVSTRFNAEESTAAFRECPGISIGVGRRVIISIQGDHRCRKALVDSCPLGGVKYWTLVDLNEVGIVTYSLAGDG